MTGLACTIGIANLDITPRLDASYQSETFFDATNTPEIAQHGACSVLSASVVVGPVAGPWRVTVGASNATDKPHRVAGNSSLSTGSGYAEVAYARPREYFATINLNF